MRHSNRAVKDVPQKFLMITSFGQHLDIKSNEGQALRERLGIAAAHLGKAKIFSQ